MVDKSSGEAHYPYFSDASENTKSAKTVSYGLRELTQDEFLTYCFTRNESSLKYAKRSTSQSDRPPSLLGEKINFTSDFEVRTFSAACFSLDSSTGMWLSSDFSILSDSTLSATHCQTFVLPRFASQVAGGIIPLPSAIDFAYVFANADFVRNLTIYLTIIIITSAYILLFIWCRYADRRDEAKSAIHLMRDNNTDNLYFYEVVIHTGTRRDAETDSKVSMNLVGTLDETCNRRLVSSKSYMKVFQRASVNTFLLSVESPLGQLSYIRIWHDNSGKGNKASWFLKFIIVHDLQTREKFYFICNKWLSLDEGDGLIDIILPVAGRKQKKELVYLVQKETKDNITNKHLWFSIAARPLLSPFTRTDRLTCCFVLLCITALVNILYYDQAPSSDRISLGPFMISRIEVFFFNPI